jgi:hypothetical protein
MTSHYDTSRPLEVWFGKVVNSPTIQLPTGIADAIFWTQPNRFRDDAHDRSSQ